MDAFDNRVCNKICDFRRCSFWGDAGNFAVHVAWGTIYDGQIDGLRNTAKLFFKGLDETFLHEKSRLARKFWFVTCLLSH